MADIYVYGTIGAPSWLDDSSDYFQLLQMRNDLDAAGGDDVTIHVNSGGGDVFDATAMSSLITEYRKAHPKCTVTTGQDQPSLLWSSTMMLTLTMAYYTPTRNSPQTIPGAVLPVSTCGGCSMCYRAKSSPSALIRQPGRSR